MSEEASPLGRPSRSRLGVVGHALVGSVRSKLVLNLAKRDRVASAGCDVAGSSRASSRAISWVVVVVVIVVVAVVKK